MSRGEVWWMEHPEIGRRPACVITRDAAIPHLRMVLVAYATTRVRGIPTEVPLEKADGLPKECALSLDNIRAVPKALLTERIAKLRSERMAEVCLALNRASGCS